MSVMSQIVSTSVLKWGCLILVLFLFFLAAKNESSSTALLLLNLKPKAAVAFLGPHWVKPGETLEVKEILSSKFVRIESHVVKTKRGDLISNWYWFDIKDQVNVLVQDLQGNFIVFRQEKYGLTTQSLAIVGGLIEEGDTTPLEAAKRELLEEMGRATVQWVFLGKFRCVFYTLSLIAHSLLVSPNSHALFFKKS